MSFTLHPQLHADSFIIGDLQLSRVLLMNNAHFPWLILVPMRTGLLELFDLAPEEYALVMQEIRMVAGKWSAYTKADKINIAALGNMVPQLHIHIIARFRDDPAWPSPVWNHAAPPRPYHHNDCGMIISQIQAALGVG